MVNFENVRKFVKDKNKIEIIGFSPDLLLDSLLLIFVVINGYVTAGCFLNV